LKSIGTTLDFRTQTALDNENEIALLSAYSSLHPQVVTSTGSSAQVAGSFPRKTCFKYRITSDTRFAFLSRKYCFTFLLDLSPSIAKVDIQHETVLTDELSLALSHSLRALSQSFRVPGSEHNFQPELYISILAYQPFYTSDSNNFIVHGFKLTLENLNSLMDSVRKKLLNFLSDLRKNIYSMEESFHSPVSADISLLNIIRFGLLTLNLLPDNCYEGIVIVTDGNLK